MGAVSDYMAGTLLSEWFRNTAFTQVATVYLGLHTADPAGTGANEVTGGSYARQPITFGAPTGSGHILTSSSTATFTGMPACTVTHLSVWDALTSGNMYLGGPSGTVGMYFTTDLSTELLKSSGHGLVAGDKVQVSNDGGAGLPTGLAVATTYFVIAGGLTTDLFKLSATSGGSAIDITADGEGFLRKLRTSDLAAGDSYEVAAGSAVFNLY